MRDGKLVVLQVLAGLNVGGAESRIMDITRNLSSTKVSYDFLIHTNEKCAYEDEALSLGCNIYRVPRFLFFNMHGYKKAMKDFFAAHPEIDIVQGHITSSAAIYLPVAKKAGVKVTIAHGRSAGVDAGLRGILTRILRKKLYKKTDYMWACSGEAAASVFGKNNADKVEFIPNAINVDKFIPANCDKEKKDELVNKYGLEGKFVVGHIGRFHYAKNHEFLLDVFKEITQLKNNAVLVLVGDGENRKMIEDKIKSLGLNESVILAGQQKNVSDYYQLFDIIVFPSRYEGLPGTIVESQAAAVPALCSDSITKDMAVTDYVEYLSLRDDVKLWAKKVVELSEKKLSLNPEIKLKEAGFDVKSQCQMLEKRYFELLNIK